MDWQRRCRERNQYGCRGITGVPISKEVLSGKEPAWLPEGGKRMRKWKIVVSVIVLVVAAAGFYLLGFTMAGGTKNRSEELTFYAEITDISGADSSYFTVRGLEVNDVNFRGDFTFSVTEDTEIEWNFTEIAPEQLQVGDFIAVTFTGDIQESDPAHIGNVVKIRLLEDEVKPLPEQEAEQSPEMGMEDAKPVIYLYPEEETEVSVELDYKGKLTTTYPAYENGWQVLARPDGTLTDLKTGREYYCLFWEGVSEAVYDLSEGFVVPGRETAAFLEDALSRLGLTEKEANEFIIHWLPRMEGNAYNLISFQKEAYTRAAQLEITPAPDSVLRVFMAWQGLEEPVPIEPQTLKSFERTGFTVVEWGGT